MTLPSPETEIPQGPKPQRLWMLTVPLLTAVFTNAFELLTLPFQGAQTIQVSRQLVEQMLGQKMPPMSAAELQTMLWMMFAFTSAVILWLYFTRRAVLEGRSWGRVSSIVIGVLSLLIFPFGTVLGVIMLIGAFDREVTNYTTK